MVTYRKRFHLDPPPVVLSDEEVCEKLQETLTVVLPDGLPVKRVHLAKIVPPVVPNVQPSWLTADRFRFLQERYYTAEEQRVAIIDSVLMGHLLSIDLSNQWEALLQRSYVKPELLGEFDRQADEFVRRHTAVSFSESSAMAAKSIFRYHRGFSFRADPILRKVGNSFLPLVRFVETEHVLPLGRLKEDPLTYLAYRW